MLFLNTKIKFEFSVQHVMFFSLYEQTLYNAKILQLQAFPRESKDKDMAAMLVVLAIDANEKSFVKIPRTWPR